MIHLPTELTILADHAAEVSLFLSGNDAPHFAQFMMDHCTGQRNNIERILEGCLHRYRQLRQVQARNRKALPLHLACDCQEMSTAMLLARSLSDQPQECNNILVVAYRGGTGSAFRQELLRGMDFQTIRESLRKEGKAVVMPQGEAVLLVPPPIYEQCMAALHQVQLRRHHVVIPESSVHILDEILSRIPAKQRPYENRKARMTVPVA